MTWIKVSTNTRDAFLITAATILVEGSFVIAVLSPGIVGDICRFVLYKFVGIGMTAFFLTSPFLLWGGFLAAEEINSKSSSVLGRLLFIIVVIATLWIGLNAKMTIN